MPTTHSPKHQDRLRGAAKRGERVATAVLNGAPPHDEPMEEGARRRKELDAFVASRVAELGDSWRELLGPLLDAEAVGRLLGVASLAEVDDLVRRRRILALPTRQGGVVYPAFQFANDGKPYAVVARVIELLAPVAVTPYTIASWLMSPKPYLRDESPIQWLEHGRDPRRIVAVARLAADHMAHF